MSILTFAVFSTTCLEYMNFMYYNQTWIIINHKEQQIINVNNSICSFFIYDD